MQLSVLYCLLCRMDSSVINMRLLVLLAVLTYTQARYTDSSCNGIIIHNINYEKEVLKSNVGSPYQLALDYDTNTLFFSYSVMDEDVFKSAYLNLKTGEFGNITGIEGGFANAVDKKRNIVYLGGRDGIYKFNYATKKAEHLPITQDNIWQLFYKDHLYYSRYPDESAFVLIDDEFQRVPELRATKAFLLGLDSYNNIYFSNSSGLYTVKKANGKTSYIAELNVNGFASDVNSNLYFSTPDGIYYINIDKKEIETLVSTENVYGLAIESDGTIIYAGAEEIIRLKPTKSLCPENEKIIYPLYPS